MHESWKPLLLQLCALVLLAMAGKSTAQNAPFPPWIVGSVKTFTPENLSQVAINSEDYFNRRGRGPHRGYKHYRRWLWFTQQRLSPDGLVISYAGLDRKVCKAPPSAPTASWQPLGPIDFGLVPGSGFNGGLGRINDFTVGPAGTVFVAPSTGGLWKRVLGASWVPLTDQEVPVPALSAVVLEPRSGSGPPPADDTIYILTGDGNGRYAPSYGVLKSTDGGGTWLPIGPDFGRETVYGYDLAITRLEGQVVLFAATTSGVYRTQDGGADWQLVLAPDGSGNGYYEVVFHPTDPSTVYAAGVTDVFRSTHGGTRSSWERLEGAPIVDSERVALAVTPAAPDDLYVLYGGSVGYQGLYVSTDRGKTFNLRSNSPNILGYDADGTSNQGPGIPWYALTIAVSPQSITGPGGTILPPRIRVGSQNVWASADGGVTWRLQSYWDNRDRRYTLVGFIHNDIHEIVDLGSTIYVASDGGISTSKDSGVTWQDQSAGLNITQIYRVSSTPQDPDVVYFGAQDNGSSILRGGVASQQMDFDGTAFIVDPNDPQQMIIGYQYGGLYKSTPRPPGSVTNFFNAMPPLNWPSTTGYVTPLVIDPQSNLFGCYVDLWQSAQGASKWANLTEGATGGNVCSALAVAPEVIYVVKGSSWLTNTDNPASIWRRWTGGDWEPITYGLNVNWISDVVVDPGRPSSAWVSVAAFGIDNVYAITAGASQWTPLTGLPQVPVYSLAYDEKTQVLYAGTQCGLYRYDPRGGGWSLDSTGMPQMQIMDLEIQDYPRGRVLHAGTLGQGVWRLPL